ncbi:Fur family ferric uptake transcriptional regulator [Paenibacillus sp. DS2015]|uniref:Fur family transcriptional regulator n=1 Tax=Paenibacillus sp. DS2015 TaxID=3373917 RepID=UPI003D1C86EB
MMSEKIHKIKRKMFDKGYKLTPQRAAIIRVLLDHSDHPISAEDIFMIVKRQLHSLGFATVYRTLELFCEMNIIHKMNSDEGLARYKVSMIQNESSSHEQLICTACGRKKEVKADWVEPLEKRIERELGFTITDYQLDIMGIFTTCSGKGCMKRKGSTPSRLSVPSL